MRGTECNLCITYVKGVNEGVMRDTISEVAVNKLKSDQTSMENRRKQYGTEKCMTNNQTHDLRNELKQQRPQTYHT